MTPLRRALGWVIALVLLAAIGVYFRQLQWQQLLEVEFRWPYLLASLLVMLICRWQLAMIWRQLLLGLADSRSLPLEACSASAINTVFAKAWLGRYVPGKITGILARAYFAAPLGFSKTAVITSSLMEAALQIGISLCLGLSCLMLLSHSFLPVSSIPLLLLLVGMLLTALSPPVLRPILTWAGKKRHLSIAAEHYHWALMAKLLLSYLGFSLFSAFGLLLLILSLTPQIELNYLQVVAAQTLSSSAGMLAIVAPSGLGVREGVQLLVLESMLSPQLLLWSLVGARLLGIIADLLYVGASLLAYAQPKRSRKETPRHSSH
ncbi:lysylphosphatidylglycerol synthase domain-containing protein [Ferrimonas aestuarii]|uniref:Lysylphosphatidylglycerol synthase TM region n=1 Tax=Ferrimonas aestuarii TaxID=2569539 RepID=A0A4U1BUY5_9GAMM|nr:lysylphosphatidylglycerol synthase domain-containing protein [Ferrimonas aestuarii]TKB58401.1 hypothetical protein FCL42_01250 [Ferrimonas aestuarii]